MKAVHFLAGILFLFVLFLIFRIDVHIREANRLRVALACAYQQVRDHQQIEKETGKTYYWEALANAMQNDIDNRGPLDNKRGDAKNGCINSFRLRGTPPENFEK